MIVAETEDGHRFVTQPDHAALAGQFADAWGNEAFEPPTPPAATAIAAHRHDDGWAPYDRRPHLHDDGTPVDFTELPPPTWIDLYDDGIDSAVDLDAYAGLLVSMHGTGLRRRRYGISPSWSDTPDDFAAFVDREEARQRRLARDLRTAGSISGADEALLSTLHETGEPPADVGSRLWRNYQRLQTWDVLSLAFCTTTSPPGYDDVGPVPTRDGGEATLAIEPLDGDAYRVEPYPFDADRIDVWVPSRSVPADAFDDEATLREAFYAAAVDLERFAIVR